MLSSTLLATAALLAGAAGPPIKTLPACENSDLVYADGVDRAPFRSALLCLINGARNAQGLPALAADPKLEQVAQAQTDRSIRTGIVTHGKSLTDINKRFARRGYRAAAYNEAFGFVVDGPTPYGFLASMTRERRVPCTQLFDPRMKDIGIGVGDARIGTNLTLEFGLKAGQKQPSANFRPQATCPHRVPNRPLIHSSIALSKPPTATESAVLAEFACRALIPCWFDVALKLPTNNATSPVQQVTIREGGTQTVTFPFDPAALAAERAASEPRVVFTFTVRTPDRYTQEVGSALLVP